MTSLGRRDGERRRDAGRQGNIGLRFQYLSRTTRRVGYSGAGGGDIYWLWLASSGASNGDLTRTLSLFISLKKGRLEATLRQLVPNIKGEGR